MEKVTDLAHFSALVKSVRQPGKKTLSNSFLMPPDIERYTKNRRMYWQSNENGVYFLCEENDFYYLYFYIEDPFRPEIVYKAPDLQKPIILDLVTKSPVMSFQQHLEDFWTMSGFRLYKQYSRYELDFPEGDRTQIYKIRLDTSQYAIGTLRQDEIPQVEALWRSNLDPYSMALPYGNDLMDMVQRNQIICIRTIEGEVVGVTRPEFHGSTAMNWNLVVDPKHHGKGLASALKYTIYIQHPEAKRLVAWIDDENTHMIEIDRALGSKRDGMIDRQFILKPS